VTALVSHDFQFSVYLFVYSSLFTTVGKLLERGRSWQAASGKLCLSILLVLRSLIAGTYFIGVESS
jgi:hypothetical protein